MNKRNTLVGPQLQRGRAGFNPDWKRLIAFVAVIGLGSIVATQVLANSYRFHPALGFNVFHVYPPWSYFLWSHQWEQPNNHSLFAQAFGIGSLVTLGGFMLLLLDVARANSKVNPFLHGSARWADRRDIKAAGLLKNNGVYVGAWRDKNGKIHYLRHAGPEHVLCYAPTRSGKGVGLILPTLLSWQQSVFVTDLKGELYELTSGWRQKYAHNRILRFEPAAAAGSCCFNPMAELRLGTEHEVGDVQNLALLIVDPDGRGLKSGDHFQKTAYSLLVGCILHLCYKAKVEGTPATFGALDRMLADTRRPILELWNEMIDEFPALGKLEILQQSLAFVAGYGIKCYLIAQDINQLKSRETGYGPDESITSNCHIQAAFPPNRLETAEHLSKLTGTTTIIKEQVTRSGRGFLGTQVSTTMQEVQRPLLTPDECQRMPGPQKDEHDRITAAGDMVIYCAGHPAIYGRQPLYFEDKTFAARAAIPAPTHSDSLSSLPVPEVKIA